MTREECEEAVKRPGKFEGEPPWAPYFYELMLDGSGETTYPGCNHDDECDCTPVDEFVIEPEDTQIFPELGKSIKVRLWVSEQGFVYTEVE